MSRSLPALQVPGDEPTGKRGKQYSLCAPAGIILPSPLSALSSILIHFLGGVSMVAADTEEVLGT